MSQTILLHSNSLTVERELIRALSPNPNFRHRDLADPLRLMLDHGAGITEATMQAVNSPESLALKTLVANFRQHPASYGLNRDAPLAEMLWRKIAPMVQRHRDILLTGFDLESDLVWLQYKCDCVSPKWARAMKILIRPEAQQTQAEFPDAWKSYGIPDTCFSEIYCFTHFGHTELRQVQQDLNDAGYFCS